MTDGERWAWIAGIIEGEGSFAVSAKDRHLQIVVRMCDGDVVQRLRDWSGVGHFRGPYTKKNRPDWSPYYDWQVCRAADIRFVLDKIEPYLGERRSKRAAELRRRAVQIPQRRRPVRVSSGQGSF